MANNLFTHSFSGNKEVIVEQSKMRFESLRHMSWGRLIGYTTPHGKPVKPGTEPQTTDSIVVVHNELKKQAGDWLKVPIHRNLKQRPRIGDQQMKDYEERPKVNFAKVPIDLIRGAELPQDGSMGEQTTKELMLVMKAKPALQRHWVRVLNWLVCSYTMYYGYSWNVINSARWAGDANISAYSHPHIYTSGAGKVSYGTSDYPGTSGYETAVATAISSLGSGDVFDTSFLEGLKADPAIMKIPYVLDSNGNPLRFIKAHPWQIYSLEQDARFNATVNSAYVQTMIKDNPLLYGMKYVWAGFGIFADETCVWPVKVAEAGQAEVTSGGFTVGDVVWGPTDVNTFTDIETFESYTGRDKFAALILGPNALMMANASGFEFRKRTDDYGEILGIAYRSITGASRGDFNNLDDGAAGQYMINESSAIAITSAGPPGF